MAGSPGLFFPEVDQKETVGQKSVSFFVKRSKKRKIVKKLAFLIVKRCKKSKNGKQKCLFDCKPQQRCKNVKKMCFFFPEVWRRPVVFFTRWYFLSGGIFKFSTPSSGSYLSIGSGQRVAMVSHGWPIQRVPPSPVLRISRMKAF